jgi:hypothetical protein
LRYFFKFPLDNEKRHPIFFRVSPNSNLEFKGEMEMDDIFDTFDWEDMGMIGGIIEEFTEDEMELLRIGKDNDEWKNEDLDAFS